MSNDWKNGMSSTQIAKVAELERQLEEVRRQQLSVASTYTKLPGIIVTLGEDPTVKTPTASPNNSFSEADQNIMDISPSLRNLAPGYVSNLAGFWTSKAKKEESMKVSSLSSGNTEQLLEETVSNFSASEELDSSQLKKSLADHFAIIENLEEDKIKLNGLIDDFKTDKAIADDLVKDLEEMLEAKCNQITNLRDSLNLCNEKLSVMLREDLEKNYKIIELEGANEDYLRIQQEMKKELEELRSSLDEAKKENERLGKEIVETKLQKEEDKSLEEKETFINDEVLRSNITMLENDANILINHYKGAKRKTPEDREKSKMIKLVTLNRSSKKKARVENLDVEQTLAFSDNNTSDVSNTSLDKSQETAFQRNSQTTFVRSSVRFSKKKSKAEESKRKPSLNILDKLKLVSGGGSRFFS